MSDEKTYQQSTLFVEDSPARDCPLPVAVRDFLMSDLDSGSSFSELLESLSRDGWLSRMSLAYCPLENEKTLPSFWQDLLDAFPQYLTGGNPGDSCEETGTMSYGECWMLSTLDWPNGAAVSSLWRVLETPEDWMGRHPGKTIADWEAYVQRFYLSPKAARGILRRAAKRGKEIPEILRMGLERVAGDGGEKE